LLLAASAMEFVELFRTTEAVAAVAYAGARAGAAARANGVSVARAAAEQRWSDTELAGPLRLEITMPDDPPGPRITVQASVEIAPVFGLLAMAPIPITCTRTIRRPGPDRGVTGASVRR
jgi:hypothetical protein